MNSIVLRLFLDFLQIGFFSIGGGYAIIPLIKAHVVDLRHWLTLREFTDIITISQMTPGPLAVNTSTFVGLQTGGLVGAVAATVGCIFSGFVISLTLYRLFDRYRSSVYAAQIIKGLKAASLGLILSAAATILVMAFSTGEGSAAQLPITVFGVNLWAVLLFAAALWGNRALRMNPMVVMVITGIAGFIIYR